MKRLNIYIAAACSMFIMSGCSDFVDIKTKGKLIPEETKNYRYLMNNTENFKFSSTISDIASDDFYIVSELHQNAINTSTYGVRILVPVYTWADMIFDETREDDGWNRMYQNIYNVNVVLDEIFRSKNDENNEKERIWAEALVHRAEAYLTLVNNYGEPYAEATASTAKGVPLLTTPRVEGSLTRASVADVYSQIFKDLENAEEYLPDVNEYSFYPSKCAIHALRARAYLIMGKYTEAKSSARAALALRGSLEDLNNYYGTNVAYPGNLYNKEVIFAKHPYTGFLSMGSLPTVYAVSPDLEALFDTDTDLRFKLFTEIVQGSVYDPETSTSKPYQVRVYKKDDLYADRNYPKYERRSVGPSVPEMMLIEAECLAREGDAPGAMNVINELRGYRFAPADYADLMAANAVEALGYVLKERRREMMFLGQRFCDQRRLIDDANYPTQTVTRVFKGQTYTLNPGDARYTFPVGQKILDMNPEIGQIR